MAIGILTLTPDGEALTGTLVIDTLRIPIVASVHGDGWHLSGPLVAGELGGGRQPIGQMRHGGYRYTVAGRWRESARGRVLTCDVTNPSRGE